ncbi:hypothetical protein NOC27_1817 [Nitrosococcus oceani AFC27]|nr:hypothetical protein NOC27_1817 [Nitrosococcus oceani AFC27]GEM19607.1 hypothetical protein NONS58_09990 [Nitrosococcus oceani]
MAEGFGIGPGYPVDEIGIVHISAMAFSGSESKSYVFKISRTNFDWLIDC